MNTNQKKPQETKEEEFVCATPRLNQWIAMKMEEQAKKKKEEEEAKKQQHP